MTSFATANARGRGTWHFAVCIPGIKYVLGTAATAPGDSWYINGGFSYLQGLDAESLRLECVAHPAEVWPELGSMDIEFHDRTGTLSSYLIALEARNTANVQTTVEKTATTVSVDSAGSFTFSNDLYCGLETWRGLSATAGTISVTRARYGSTARRHIADSEALIPCTPVVSDGPGDLRGRRVLLYAAEERGGVMSAYNVVWRGYVSGWPDKRPYWISIPVSHVLRGWLDGEGFGEVPSGILRGIYVPNVPGRRWGRMVLRGAASANVVVDLVASGTATFFPSREAFFSACQGALAGETGSWTLTEGTDQRAIITYYTAGVSEVAVDLDNSGLPILLGFEPSYPHLDPIKRATFPVADVFTDLTHTAATVGCRIYLREGEAAVFSETGVRLEDASDTDYGIVRVLDVNTTDDYLEIEGRFPDSTIGGGAEWPELILVTGGNPAPTVRQVWTLDGEISDVIRALWCGALYDGARGLRYTLPEHWLPCLACASSDVDWDGLRSLVRHVAGGHLTRIGMAITEPTDMTELVTGWLLACGVYAAVNTVGQVTWHLAGMPAEGQDAGSTPLTDAMLDADRVTTIRTEDGSESLLNAVKLAIPIGYDTDGKIKTRPLYIIDSASMQRYGRRGPRSLESVTEEAKEIVLGISPDVVEAAADFETAVAANLQSTLFGMLSRPRATVRLPTAPTARGYAIGDVVRLTTEWALDPMTGGVGLTERLALVLGWLRPLGYSGQDELVVMLANDGFGLISPAALATSFDAGSKVVTVADATRYKLDADDTDLDYVEIGDEVWFRTYNDATPDWYRATVAGVSKMATNGTVTLDVDPFSGAFATSIMSFARYSSCTTDQTGEGWVWLASATDGEVEGLRDGWRWAT